MIQKGNPAGATMKGEASCHLNNCLPALLSVIAGMVDVAGYMSLGHVFTAHITGNIVVIAADLVSQTQVNIVQVIAIPVFIVAVCAVWLLALVWGRSRPNLLRLLLVIHSFLLVGVLLCGVLTRPFSTLNDFSSGVTAMMAVSAMACQFALLRLVMPEAPSTAVMTGNLASAVLALLDLLAERRADPFSRKNLVHSLHLIIGFVVGCVLAAAALPLLGDWVWLLPATLAAIAIAI